MIATIKLTPQEVTEEDIEQIFEIFCTAFEVRHFPHETEFWKTEGLKELRAENQAVYSLQSGAIFKAEYLGNGQTRFDGCSWIEDPMHDKKLQKFVEALKKYETSISSRNKTSSEYQHRQE